MSVAKDQSMSIYSAGLWNGYFDPILIIPYVGKDQSHFPKVRGSSIVSIPILSGRRRLFLTSFKLCLVQLKSTLGIPFDDMLFFDDEHGNIRQVSLSLQDSYSSVPTMCIFKPSCRVLRQTYTCPQVSKLGVTSILVSTGDGLSLRAFEQGMKSFAKNKES